MKINGQINLTAGVKKGKTRERWTWRNEVSDDIVHMVTTTRNYSEGPTNSAVEISTPIIIKLPKCHLP